MLVRCDVALKLFHPSVLDSRGRPVLGLDQVRIAYS